MRFFSKVAFACAAIVNIVAAPFAAVVAATVHSQSYSAETTDHPAPSRAAASAIRSDAPPASAAAAAFEKNEPFSETGIRSAIRNTSSHHLNDPVLNPLTAASFPVIDYTGFTPPDAAVIATPSRVIVAVNGRYAMVDKATLRILESKSPTAFHGQTGFIFDPRLWMDKHTGRIIAIDVRETSSSGSRILLSVSKISDPQTLGSADWDNYYIQVSDTFDELATHWADYPIVGSDVDNVYIHYNGFTNTNSFYRTNVVSIAKSVVLGSSGRKLVFNTDYKYSSTDSTRSSFAVPVNTASPAMGVLPNQKLFLVGRLSSGMWIQDVTSTGAGQPVNIVERYFAGIPGLTTPSSDSRDASQLGTSTQVDISPLEPATTFLLDNRYLYAVMATRNADNTGSDLMWTIFDTVDRVTVDSGRLRPSEPMSSRPSYFFPAIVPDVLGNIGVSAHYSSTERYISGVFYHRKAEDTPGTMREPEIKIAGLSPFTSTRYGDYSASSLDPDGRRMWFTSQIPSGGRSWKMFLSELCPSCDGCPECTGNAVCNQATLTCVCLPGYTGSNCLDCDEGYYKDADTLECLVCPDCSLSGVCGDNGLCVCNNGFAGTNCERCDTGFFGTECDGECPGRIGGGGAGCLNGGTCDDGKLGTGECVCVNGFTVDPDTGLCTDCVEGRYTEECIPCPDCNNNGVCGEETNGVCECNANHAGEFCQDCAEGFFGSDCRPCPVCLNGGVCGAETSGMCDCPPGWTGVLCDVCVGTVDNNDCGECECGAHGECTELMDGELVCECDPGFAGENCEVCAEGHVGPNCVKCEGDCGPNGVCSTEDGKCLCNQGWETSDISDDSFCDICKEEWYQSGDQCLECPDCGPNGECSEEGDCDCNAGWEGERCDACEEEYFGANCQFCPNCGVHGECDDGITGTGACICEPNWAVSAETGQCTDCAAGFVKQTDPETGSEQCVPENKCEGVDCGRFGVCNSETGECDCIEGRTGPGCKECEEDHFGRQCYSCEECQGERCSREECCVCKPGQLGRFCELCDRRAELGVVCSGHGQCVAGRTCECSPGWGGVHCEICVDESVCSTECPKDCGAHGTCVGGVCFCDRGWKTSDPDGDKECDECRVGFKHEDCPNPDCGPYGRLRERRHDCVCQRGFSGELCNVCHSCLRVNEVCPANVTTVLEFEF